LESPPKRTLEKLSPSSPGIPEVEPDGPEGAGNHACGRRDFQCQRWTSQGTRPVCLCAPHPLLTRRTVPLYPDIHLTIIRENTEDLYTGIEHEIIPRVVEGLKVITEKASLRIARFAFQYAQQAGYSRVTAVHKANIMKLTDGLFLNCCRQAAQEFPNIAFDDKIVDSLSMRLVMQPQEFGVLVAPNLYGNILSDLAAGLVGGLGLVSGANIGEDCAVFEAVHGSWPEAAGKGIANPTSMILTAAMLLRHLGEEETAQAIEEAVKATLREGSCVTRDLGGSATTEEFTEAVINHLPAYSEPW
jgi:isocitrate dehydrogenase (NAD+)